MNILAHENVIEAQKLDGVGVGDEAVGEWSETENEVVEKTMTTLGIYPRLSWTHLQVSLGTSLKPAFWKPIIFRLIEERKLKLERVQYKAVDGRERTYQVISLPDAPL